MDAVSNDLAAVFRELPGYHDEAKSDLPFPRAYIGWAPGDDYMSGEGWRANLSAGTWREFWDGFKDSDPDLNLVADFYFSLTHDTKPCDACEESGYNPATHRIAEDFYDFAQTGRKWNDAITQDEVQALVDHNRLYDFTHTFKVGEGWKRREDGHVPTATEVNAWQRGRGLGHDGINRGVLIQARATRLGVYGLCPECSGEGFVRTGEDRIALNLWVLHPRKGCGRGWTIRSVSPDDIPEVRAFLRGQIEYHKRTRFAWALAEPTDPSRSPHRGATE